MRTTRAALLISSFVAFGLAAVPASAQKVTGTLGSPSATTTIPGN